MARVRVEFFGLARQSSGVEFVDINVQSIAQAIHELSGRFPLLAQRCFRDGKLAPGWTFNINGRHFTRSTDAELLDGTNLLLLTSDAGG